MSGTALQTVSFENLSGTTYSYFNILEVTNGSLGGITFSTNIVVNGLFNHNLNVFNLLGSNNVFIDYDGDDLLDFADDYPLLPRSLDLDNDGVSFGNDNCPSVFNPAQLNFDADNLGDACDLDDDNDGMADIWEVQYGLNPLDASDAMLDLDNDGVNNLAEFKADTDPSIKNISTSQRIAVQYTLQMMMNKKKSINKFPAYLIPHAKN